MEIPEKGGLISADHQYIVKEYPQQNGNKWGGYRCSPVPPMGRVQELYPLNLVNKEDANRQIDKINTDGSDKLE